MSKSDGVNFTKTQHAQQQKMLSNTFGANEMDIIAMSGGRTNYLFYDNGETVPYDKAIIATIDSIGSVISTLVDNNDNKLDKESIKYLNNINTLARDSVLTSRVLDQTLQNLESVKNSDTPGEILHSTALVLNTVSEGLKQEIQPDKNFTNFLDSNIAFNKIINKFDDAKYIEDLSPTKNQAAIEAYTVKAQENESPLKLDPPKITSVNLSDDQSPTVTTDTTTKPPRPTDQSIVKSGREATVESDKKASKEVLAPTSQATSDWNPFTPLSVIHMDTLAPTIATSRKQATVASGPVINYFFYQTETKPAPKVRTYINAIGVEISTLAKNSDQKLDEESIKHLNDINTLVKENVLTPGLLEKTLQNLKSVKDSDTPGEILHSSLLVLNTASKRLKDEITPALRDITSLDISSKCNSIINDFDDKKYIEDLSPGNSLATIATYSQNIKNEATVKPTMATVEKVSKKISKDELALTSQGTSGWNSFTPVSLIREFGSTHYIFNSREISPFGETKTYIDAIDVEISALAKNSDKKLDLDEESIKHLNDINTLVKENFLTPDLLKKTLQNLKSVKGSDTPGEILHSNLLVLDTASKRLKDEITPALSDTNSMSRNIECNRIIDEFDDKKYIKELGPANSLATIAAYSQNIKESEATVKPNTATVEKVSKDEIPTSPGPSGLNSLANAPESTAPTIQTITPGQLPLDQIPNPDSQKQLVSHDYFTTQQLANPIVKKNVYTLKPEDLIIDVPQPRVSSSGLPLSPTVEKTLKNAYDVFQTQTDINKVVSLLPPKVHTELPNSLSPSIQHDERQIKSNSEFSKVFNTQGWENIKFSESARPVFEILQGMEPEQRSLLFQVLPPPTEENFTNINTLTTNINNNINELKESDKIIYNSIPDKQITKLGKELTKLFSLEQNQDRGMPYEAPKPSEPQLLNNMSKGLQHSLQPALAWDPTKHKPARPYAETELGKEQTETTPATSGKAAVDQTQHTIAISQNPSDAMREYIEQLSQHQSSPFPSADKRLVPTTPSSQDLVPVPKSLKDLAGVFDKLNQEQTKFVLNLVPKDRGTFNESQSFAEHVNKQLAAAYADPKQKMILNSLPEGTFDKLGEAYLNLVSSTKDQNLAITLPIEHTQKSTAATESAQTLYSPADEKSVLSTPLKTSVVSLDQLITTVKPDTATTGKVNIDDYLTNTSQGTPTWNSLANAPKPTIDTTAWDPLKAFQEGYAQEKDRLIEWKNTHGRVQNREESAGTIKKYYEGLNKRFEEAKANPEYKKLSTDQDKVEYIEDKIIHFHHYDSVKLSDRHKTSVLKKQYLAEQKNTLIDAVENLGRKSEDNSPEIQTALDGPAGVLIKKYIELKNDPKSLGEFDKNSYREVCDKMIDRYAEIALNADEVETLKNLKSPNNTEQIKQLEYVRKTLKPSEVKILEALHPTLTPTEANAPKPTIDTKDPSIATSGKAAVDQTQHTIAISQNPSDAMREYIEQLSQHQSSPFPSADKRLVPTTPSSQDLVPVPKSLKDLAGVFDKLNQEQTKFVLNLVPKDRGTFNESQSFAEHVNKQLAAAYADPKQKMILNSLPEGTFDKLGEAYLNLVSSTKDQNLAITLPIEHTQKSTAATESAQTLYSPADEKSVLSTPLKTSVVSLDQLITTVKPDTATTGKVNIDDYLTNTSQGTPTWNSLANAPKPTIDTTAWDPLKAFQEGYAQEKDRLIEWKNTHGRVQNREESAGTIKKYYEGLNKRFEEAKANPEYKKLSTDQDKVEYIEDKIIHFHHYDSVKLSDRHKTSVLKKQYLAEQKNTLIDAVENLGRKSEDNSPEIQTALDGPAGVLIKKYIELKNDPKSLGEFDKNSYREVCDKMIDRYAEIALNADEVETLKNLKSPNNTEQIKQLEYVRKTLKPSEVKILEALHPTLTPTEANAPKPTIDTKDPSIATSGKAAVDQTQHTIAISQNPSDAMREYIEQLSQHQSSPFPSADKRLVPTTPSSQDLVPVPKSLKDLAGVFDKLNQEQTKFVLNLVPKDRGTFNESQSFAEHVNKQLAAAYADPKQKMILNSLPEGTFDKLGEAYLNLVSSTKDQNLAITLPIEHTQKSTAATESAQTLYSPADEKSVLSTPLKTSVVSLDQLITTVKPDTATTGKVNIDDYLTNTSQGTPTWNSLANAPKPTIDTKDPSIATSGKAATFVNNLEIPETTKKLEKIHLDSVQSVSKTYKEHSSIQIGRLHLPTTNITKNSNIIQNNQEDIMAKSTNTKKEQIEDFRTNIVEGIKNHILALGKQSDDPNKQKIGVHGVKTSDLEQIYGENGIIKQFSELGTNSQKEFLDGIRSEDSQTINRSRELFQDLFSKAHADLKKNNITFFNDNNGQAILPSKFQSTNVDALATYENPSVQMASEVPLFTILTPKSPDAPFPPTPITAQTASNLTPTTLTPSFSSQLAEVQVTTQTDKDKVAAADQFFYKITENTKTAASTYITNDDVTQKSAIVNLYDNGIKKQYDKLGNNDKIDFIDNVRSGNKKVVNGFYKSLFEEALGQDKNKNTILGNFNLGIFNNANNSAISVTIDSIPTLLPNLKDLHLSKETSVTLASGVQTPSATVPNPTVPLATDLIHEKALATTPQLTNQQKQAAEAVTHFNTICDLALNNEYLLTTTTSKQQEAIGSIYQGMKEDFKGFTDDAKETFRKNSLSTNNLEQLNARLTLDNLFNKTSDTIPDIYKAEYQNLSFIGGVPKKNAIENFHADAILDAQKNREKALAKETSHVTLSAGLSKVADPTKITPSLAVASAAAAPPSPNIVTGPPPPVSSKSGPPVISSTAPAIDPKAAVLNPPTKDALPPSSKVAAPTTATTLSTATTATPSPNIVTGPPPPVSSKSGPPVISSTAPAIDPKAAVLNPPTKDALPPSSKVAAPTTATTLSTATTATPSPNIVTGPPPPVSSKSGPPVISSTAPAIDPKAAVLNPPTKDALPPSSKVAAPTTATTLSTATTATPSPNIVTGPPPPVSSKSGPPVISSTAPAIDPKAAVLNPPTKDALPPSSKVAAPTTATTLSTATTATPSPNIVTGPPPPVSSKSGPPVISSTAPAIDPKAAVLNPPTKDALPPSSKVAAPTTATTLSTATTATPSPNIVTGPPPPVSSKSGPPVISSTAPAIDPKAAVLNPPTKDALPPSSKVAAPTTATTLSTATTATPSPNIVTGPPPPVSSKSGPPVISSTAPAIDPKAAVLNPPTKDALPPSSKVAAPTTATTLSTATTATPSPNIVTGPPPPVSSKSGPPVISSTAPAIDPKAAVLNPPTKDALPPSSKVAAPTTATTLSTATTATPSPNIVTGPPPPVSSKSGPPVISSTAPAIDPKAAVLNPPTKDALPPSSKVAAPTTATTLSTATTATPSPNIVTGPPPPVSSKSGPPVISSTAPAIDPKAAVLNPPTKDALPPSSKVAAPTTATTLSTATTATPSPNIVTGPPPPVSSKSGPPVISSTAPAIDPKAAVLNPPTKDALPPSSKVAAPTTATTLSTATTATPSPNIVTGPPPPVSSKSGPPVISSTASAIDPKAAEVTHPTVKSAAKDAPIAEINKYFETVASSLKEVAKDDPDIQKLFSESKNNTLDKDKLLDKVYGNVQGQVLEMEDTKKRQFYNQITSDDPGKKDNAINKFNRTIVEVLSNTMDTSVPKTKESEEFKHVLSSELVKINNESLEHNGKVPMKEYEPTPPTAPQPGGYSEEVANQYFKKTLMPALRSARHHSTVQPLLAYPDASEAFKNKILDASYNRLEKDLLALKPQEKEKVYKQINSQSTEHKDVINKSEAIELLNRSINTYLPKEAQRLGVTINEPQKTFFKQLSDKLSVVNHEILKSPSITQLVAPVKPLTDIQKMDNEFKSVIEGLKLKAKEAPENTKLFGEAKNNLHNKDALIERVYDSVQDQVLKSGETKRKEFYEQLESSTPNVKDRAINSINNTAVNAVKKIIGDVSGKGTEENQQLAQSFAKNLIKTNEEELGHSPKDKGINFTLPDWLKKIIKIASTPATVDPTELSKLEKITGVFHPKTPPTTPVVLNKDTDDLLELLEKTPKPTATTPAGKEKKTDTPIDQKINPEKEELQQQLQQAKKKLTEAQDLNDELLQHFTGNADTKKPTSTKSTSTTPTGTDDRSAPPSTSLSDTTTTRSAASETRERPNPAAEVEQERFRHDPAPERTFHNHEALPQQPRYEAPPQQRRYETPPPTEHPNTHIMSEDEAQTIRSLVTMQKYSTPSIAQSATEVLGEMTLANPKGVAEVIKAIDKEEGVSSLAYEYRPGSKENKSEQNIANSRAGFPDKAPSEAQVTADQSKQRIDDVFTAPQQQEVKNLLRKKVEKPKISR